MTGLRSLIYFILPFTDVRNFSDRKYNKINKESEKVEKFRIKFRRSVNVAYGVPAMVDTCRAGLLSFKESCRSGYFFLCLNGFP